METPIYRSEDRISSSRLLLPWAVVAGLLQHRGLIAQFTRREVLARYKGTVLGILSSLVKPLSMLAIYVVVFGVIFQSRFRDENEPAAEFALAMFCGLILFEFFAECVGRAPGLILATPNYVTKVVFPLEILPVSVVGAALVHLFLDLSLLLIGFLAFRHFLFPTVALVPLLLVPLMLLTLGLTWLLSGLGVFLRDIASFIRPVMTIVMYASAIFYPMSKVPAALRPWVEYNPIAILIEQARRILLWGQPIEWGPWGVACGAGLVVFFLGYFVFMRTKHAFADVL